MATAGDETPTAVVLVERGIGIDVFLARMNREGVRLSRVRGCHTLLSGASNEAQVHGRPLGSSRVSQTG
jgi:hypothetical protein